MSIAAGHISTSDIVKPDLLLDLREQIFIIFVVVTLLRTSALDIYQHLGPGRFVLSTWLLPFGPRNTTVALVAKNLKFAVCYYHVHL